MIENNSNAKAEKLFSAAHFARQSGQRLDERRFISAADLTPDIPYALSGRWATAISGDPKLY